MLAIVVGNAADDSFRALGLDARDQRRGRQIVHGREKLGEGDVFDLGGARFQPGPAVDAAIVTVLHGVGSHARWRRAVTAPGVGVSWK